MVSPSTGLSASEIARRLTRYLETRAKGPQGALSQRDIAKAVDIPRSTLGDFLRNPEGRRAATVDKIARQLSSPVFHSPVIRDRTIRIDAPLFTPESLRFLSRPDHATGFRFVYEEPGYAGGYGSTVLTDFRNDSPEDALGLAPYGVEGIVSIIWYTGPRA